MGLRGGWIRPSIMASIGSCNGVACCGIVVIHSCNARCRSSSTGFEGPITAGITSVPSLVARGKFSGRLSELRTETIWVSAILLMIQLAWRRALFDYNSVYMLRFYDFSWDMLASSIKLYNSDRERLKTAPAPVSVMDRLFHSPDVTVPPTFAYPDNPFAAAIHAYLAKRRKRWIALHCPF